MNQPVHDFGDFAKNSETTGECTAAPPSVGRRKSYIVMAVLEAARAVVEAARAVVEAAAVEVVEAAAVEVVETARAVVEAAKAVV